MQQEDLAKAKKHMPLMLVVLGAMIVVYVQFYGFRLTTEGYAGTLLAIIIGMTAAIIYAGRIVRATR